MLARLRLHSRARGVVDPVQPEHAVVLAAGQLPCGVLIAGGPADAIKMHRGVTGTRHHVHTAAVALDQAAQTRCLLVTYSVRAQGLLFPAQSELREEPVLI
jgi:hypothetical protein